jgi:hypothetical protein
MPTKNLSQHNRESKFPADFRISNTPIGRPDHEQGKDVSEFGNGIGLPRLQGAPILFAIARDPGTIFNYWRIDWTAVFSKTAPVDRQVHLRVYLSDGAEEASVAVEPMSGSCSIAVSRPSGSYYVEIGYYQPADAWNSIATSQEITMPPNNLLDHRDVDLATIPFHLSFQRLLELLGGSTRDALAETISEFQTRALDNETRGQLSAQEREILRAMDLSLSEIAAARSAFGDATTESEILHNRTEALLGFSATSPSRAFSESS